MDVEVHFISKRELLHEFPELFEGIEKHNSAASVEVVGFDQPHVHAVVHFRFEGELAVDDIFVFEVVLDAFVGRNEGIDVLDLVSLALVVVLFPNPFD